MTDAELMNTLEEAQEAIRTALETENYEALPDLIADRMEYLVEFSAKAQDNDNLRAWATEYLAADRLLLSSAMHSRAEVKSKIGDNRTKKGASVAYLRTVK